MPVPPDLQALIPLAQRYVWWEPPEKALANRDHFLWQLMKLGTLEDVSLARKILGDDAFVQALNRAQAGALDAKSWNFWHLFFHLAPRPLPSRAHRE